MARGSVECSGRRQRGHERVYHHIANELHPLGRYTLALKILDRITRWGKKDVCHVIGNNPVEFFWHGTVATPQPGFHVTNRYTCFGSDQCGGHGRIDVSVNEHDVRLGRKAKGLEPHHYLRGLTSM